ncbi:MAG: hypothetical protein HYS04_00685 [Acidobacteria bacterium]|nr:hypothetical protein [Acidobacteriota bacterium]
MLLRLIAAVALASLALSCNGDGELNEVGTMLIGLPDGTRVKAEVMTKPEDMMRGMNVPRQAAQGPRHAVHPRQPGPLSLLDV